MFPLCMNGIARRMGMDEKMNLCSIQHILGTDMSIFSLIDVISAWRSKNTYGLSYEQKLILIDYNNMH